MKNQYLVVFIASVFLVACTTTPKSNNYSYTEAGRWIASVEEKSDAKASAIMLLTDRAVSSCESVNELMNKVQAHRSRGERVQISEEDIKLALVKMDDEGNVSLRNNPDCKSNIYALAQVMCDGTNDSDPLCEAVELRKEIDRTILRLQTADSETTKEVIEELSEMIKDQEREYKVASQQLGPDYAILQLQHQLESADNEDEVREITKKLAERIKNRERDNLILQGKIPQHDKTVINAVSIGSSLVMMLTLPFSALAVSTAGFMSSMGPLFIVLLLLEGSILAYSLFRALEHCRDVNVEKCRRNQFAGLHNDVWSGIIKTPVKLIARTADFFRRIF